jgi:hypothetical protein
MQQDRQVALSVLTTRCFPDSPFPGKKLRDHFIVRFVGAMNRNRTGTLQLAKCMCCRYTIKAPLKCVPQSQDREIKNGDTEVSPFLLQGLPGFPDRISPLKRVPKTYCSENL